VLAQRLGVPLVHADDLVRGREEGEWQPELNAHADRDAWVIDGMKLSILEHRVERADTVVFLDLPRRSCFAGVVRRDGIRALWSGGFARWMWTFPHHARPRIREILERHRDDTEIVVLRSRRAARRFVAAG
jgi:adenylate kinase family enzyme